MENLVEYRESDYFNETDDFLVLINLKRFYVTQVHFYNGAWYTNEGCKYKATSIKAINCNELYQVEVTYAGTDLRGKITKSITPDGLGVNWYQGQWRSIKQYGLPMHWNIAENLKT